MNGCAGARRAHPRAHADTPDAGRSSNGRAGARRAYACAAQGPRIGVAKAERDQQAAQDDFAGVMHEQAPQGCVLLQACGSRLVE